MVLADPYPANTENTIDPALVAQIQASAERAYGVLAETHGLDKETVHRQPLCHEAAQIMVGSLVVTIKPALVEQTTRGGWSVDEHSFVTITPPNGGPIIADPTWQQFFRNTEPPKDAPRVLIGSPEYINDTLNIYGFPKSDRALWHPPAALE